MKTAICLHGYFNSQRDIHSHGIDGFVHLKKRVIDVLDGNVDVYIHTWDETHVKQIADVYGNWIHRLMYEPQKDFKPICDANGLNTFPRNPSYPPIESAFSQIYSVQKSIELMVDSGINYDCVIKSRFDIGRINRNSSGPLNGNNPYPVQCITFDTSLDMDKFHIADWQYMDTEGPPDMWFYSSGKNMSRLSTAYDIIESDVKVGSEYQDFAGLADNGMINGIKMWKWVLLKTHLWEISNRLPTFWE
jgi:hypothetical protein